VSSVFKNNDSLPVKQGLGFKIRIAYSREQNIDNLKLRHLRCVRYNKMVQDIRVKTQLVRQWSILLLRQHVSVLALGHHEVSSCAS